jgi:hypothetical protein
MTAFRGRPLFIKIPPMSQPNINDKTVRVIVICKREK